MRRFCAFLASLLLFFIQANADSLLVETKSGPIQGIKIPGKCSEANAWYGIPYAKPPIKELRYKRPVPVDPWSETLQADTKPNACYQTIVKPNVLYPGLTDIEPESLSEDCLYLNVVTPTEFEEPLPVMVWIHGGSFISGATRMHLYDTECLSNIGRVITVSIGYRLGNLGFLYLDEDTAPGNMALVDQQLALKWVKENIEAFGGDPEQITIHGQSAGGSSITFQLLAEGSRDLYKRAIVQSGASNAVWSWISNERAQRTAKNFAARAGCADTSDHKTLLKCLQEVDVNRLIRSEEKTGLPEFPPTLDGYFVKDNPWNLLSKTDFSGRHVMIGATSDEGDIFALMFLLGVGTDIRRIPNNVTKNEAEHVFDKIAKILPIDVSEDTKNTVFNHYSEKTNNDYFKVVSDGGFGDLLITCPVNNFADGLVKNGAQVYKYVFSHVTKFTIWGMLGLNATHSEELFYMFGEPLKKDAKFVFTLFEKLLSKHMIKYWSDFAKTGELRRNLLQPWPLYDEKDKKYVDIDLLGTSVKEDFRGEYCDFFKEIE